jgi:nucleoside triphosphate pyrophosphatase
MPSLVLASSSPRRAALLSESGFEFDVAPPRVAEKFDAALTLRELTLWNAIRKGMSMAQTRPDAVVLAADTLVALKNEIIGKPADLDQATDVLQRLSGRTHEVCSAVLIYHQTSGRLVVFHEVSRVRFHRLNRAMIKKYFAKVDPLDKAGAYAAQGSGAEIIANIEGSYTNVVGLPMEKTIPALAKFGIRPKKS